MRSWFPFTDYDFYAYLISGGVFVAGIDFLIFGSTFAGKDSWTFIEILFVLAASYVLGHVMSSLSAILIEHAGLSWFFRPPSVFQLGLRSKRVHESLIAWLFAQREYVTLPNSISSRVLEGCDNDLSDKKKIDHAYLRAFVVVRENSDTADRMNKFQNLYGFCRSLSATAFTLLVLSFIVEVTNLEWMGFFRISLLTIGIFLYGRYLKFYGAYSREVFRAYGREPTGI